MKQEVLTIKEVAEYFGVTPAVIRRMIHRREIPYIRIGRQYRFQWEELDHWMQSQETLASR